MTRVIARMATETVNVAVFDGVDGQGLPSYDSPVDIEARVIEETEEVLNADGSATHTSLTLYVPPGETPRPNRQDRITWDGSDYIVEVKEAPKGLDGTVDHVKAMCRDE